MSTAYLSTQCLSWPTSSGRRNQELLDAHIEAVKELEGLNEEEHEQLKKQQLAKNERIEDDILPGYVKKLTGGYEYRT